MFNNTVKITLHVENMHCGHCAARVEVAARSVKGVKKATVDLESASVEIVAGKNVDIDAVVKAISDAGYPASK